MQNQGDIEGPWWTLRLTYGLVPIVAGLDKFANLLVDWPRYVSPMVERVLPMSPSAFMAIVGIIEIVAGVIVLSRWTRFGAYLVSAWLIAIAFNLLTTGAYFDVAVRDVVMAIGAFTLAKLTELRARAQVGSARLAAGDEVEQAPVPVGRTSGVVR